MSIEEKIRQMRIREEAEAIPNEIEIELNGYICHLNKMPTDEEIRAFKYAYKQARIARMDAILKLLEESKTQFQLQADALREALRRRGVL
jgi:hypothetical protein